MMVKMKSMFAIGFAFTSLLSMFNSIFDGRVVAKLPFTPITWLQVWSLALIRTTLHLFAAKIVASALKWGGDLLVALLTLAAVQLVLALWRIDSCLLLLLQKVKINKMHWLFVDRGAFNCMFPVSIIVTMAEMKGWTSWASVIQWYFVGLSYILL